MKDRSIAIGLFSFLMFFSLISVAQAELWELIIDVDVQKGAIYSGETVVVTGKIVNHAYSPIEGLEVLIRAGSDTVKASTDSNGVFQGEFKDFQRIPGIYIVNIVASGDGMTGLANTQFQVKGEIAPVSELQQKLSTEEARKYLGANESDFEKNPIGQTLFKYYHGLLKELVQEHKEVRKSLTEQKEAEQEKNIAENLRQQAIKEYNPKSGIYEGYQYERYIANLNPEVKDLVLNQLNFTNSMFEESQKIRDKIIEKGGTYEEARQAYLNAISIPRDVLEQFNEIELEKISKEVAKEEAENKKD